MSLFQSVKKFLQRQGVLLQFKNTTWRKLSYIWQYVEVGTVTLGMGVNVLNTLNLKRTLNSIKIKSPNYLVLRQAWNNVWLFSLNFDTVRLFLHNWAHTWEKELTSFHPAFIDITHNSPSRTLESHTSHTLNFTLK